MVALVIGIALLVTIVVSGALVWWLQSSSAVDSAHTPADFTTSLFVVEDSWLDNGDNDMNVPVIAVVRPRGSAVLLRALYPSAQEATAINALTPGDRISVRYLTAEMAAAEHQNLFDRAINLVTGDAMKMVSVYRLSYNGGELFVRPDDQPNAGHRFAHVPMDMILIALGIVVVAIAALIGGIRRARLAAMLPGDRMMMAQRQSKGRRP